MEVTEQTTKHWVYGQGTKEEVKQTKSLVTISCNRGLVKCKEYTDGISGDDFARMIDNCFPEVFKYFINPFARHFL